MQADDGIKGIKPRAVVRKSCVTCRHAVVNSGDAFGPRDANRDTEDWSNRCRWCIRLFEDRWEARDGEIGYDVTDNRLNTSDPEVHQEGVGTSDDVAHGGMPPVTVLT